jgi:tRNA-dihydrouridine synthase B
MFSWNDTTRPVVALAPMSGVTDSSYRQLIKLIEPSTVVYTEFLSSDAIFYGGEKTMRMMQFNAEVERPFIVQIFGADPDHFLEAAKVIEGMGADGIDINMGCPAAKVVSSCHGSALIKNSDLAAEIVQATKKAVSIPVSVKTRLGWDTKETLVEFGKKMVEAGAEALAIHGRTYKQKYKGDADWDPIYELKKHVNVPVLGNGDVRSAQIAVDKLQNLDGVMVGRGTYGNPWIMRDIKKAFETGVIENTKESLTFEQKIPVILQHCELAVEHKGEEKGILEMRKHFSSYARGFDGAADLRGRLVHACTMKDVKDLLKY